MTRRWLIASVHKLKRAAGLDDAAYRALLVETTGKDSAGDMDALQLNAAIAALGARAKAAAGARPRGTPPAGKLVGKLRALWITAWQLGAVDDRTDEALTAFAKRQLGVDDLRFLPAREADKAIEGLREMCARCGWRPPAGTAPETALRELLPVLAAKLAGAGDPRPTETILKHTLGAEPLGAAPLPLLKAAAMDLARRRRTRERHARKRAAA